MGERATNLIVPLGRLAKEANFRRCGHFAMCPHAPALGDFASERSWRASLRAPDLSNEQGRLDFLRCESRPSRKD